MKLDDFRNALRDDKQPLAPHLGYHRVRMLLRMRPPMRAYLDTLDATELGALMALDLDGASKLPGEQAYKLTDRGFEKLQEYLNR